MAFSPKQKAILRFPYMGYDAIIADGAVRSGKTSVMVLSFFLWGMNNFSDCAFAFCGKSIKAAERNIIKPERAIQHPIQSGRPCDCGQTGESGKLLLCVRRQR